jgi:hypothetical protein
MSGASGASEAGRCTVGIHTWRISKNEHCDMNPCDARSLLKYGASSTDAIFTCAASNAENIPGKKAFTMLPCCCLDLGLSWAIDSCRPLARVAKSWVLTAVAAGHRLLEEAAPVPLAAVCVVG